MSRAFTMVELIFVIVIIGILVTIAVPKLSATKDDAKSSKICHNVAVCVTDAAAIYTAKQTVNLSTIDSCRQNSVSGLVSLDGSGTSITVSGVPTICAHLNRTYDFGGNRVSI